MSLVWHIFRDFWRRAALPAVALAIVVGMSGPVRAADFGGAAGPTGADNDAALAGDVVVIYDFPEPYSVGVAFHNALTIGAYWNSRIVRAPIDWDFSKLLGLDKNDLLAAPTPGSVLPDDAVAAAAKSEVVSIPVNVAPADASLAVAPMNVDSTGEQTDNNWDDVAAGVPPPDISPTAIYVGVAGLVVVVGLIGLTVAFGGKPELSKGTIDSASDIASLRQRPGRRR